MGLPPRRIDLLTEITGVVTDEVFASCVIGQVGALRLRFIGRDALIANKRATGRPKDGLDVIELEKLAR